MWISTNDKTPKENQPVILSNIMDLNSNECHIGYLTIDKKTKDFVWHVGNQKFIKVESRKYWHYLLALDLSIPKGLDDESLLPYFNHYLTMLSVFERKFLFIIKAMMESGNGFYHLDLYINGIASRSLSLIYGFETLIRSNNYMSAAHLARPHLDNYLRLFAAWQVNAPHDFASKVMNGEMVRNLYDKNEKKMTDSYLSSLASKQFPWIQEVYNETSGFIHFSHKHIFTALKKSTKSSNSLVSVVSKYDNSVSNYSKIEACNCMIEISNCIIQLIFGYVITKQIKG
jgi:hypothetical protein